jgi:putative inorganic carbon (HCO3(-)) transporter
VVAAGALAVGLAGLLAFSSSGPVGVVLDRLTSVSDPGGNPYDVRPITWGEALREFSEQPVLGNGPGTFGVLSAQSPSELQFYPREHAHNGLLTISAETGSVGAIALIGLGVTLVVTVRGGARRLRATHRFEDLGVLAGGAAALAALTGHLTVDFPLRNPVLMVTVWAVIGVVLAATAVPASPGQRARTLATYAGGGA